MDRWRPCRSKISGFLEAIASKSSNTNKNSQITIERAIFKPPTLLLKLLYWGQYNNWFYSYISRNLLIFFINRVITAKFSLVITHTSIKNFINITILRSNKNINGNSIVHISVLIMFIFSRNGSGKSIIYTSIAIILIFSGSANEKSTIYTSIATMLITSGSFSKRSTIYTSPSIMLTASKSVSGRFITYILITIMLITNKSSSKRSIIYISIAIILATSKSTSKKSTIYITITTISSFNESANRNITRQYLGSIYIFTYGFTNRIKLATANFF